MNTSKYIPFGCVSPNIVVVNEFKDYPGLYGTGFFCHFPPYDCIFYVTARHCVKDLLDENSNSSLKIPLSDGTNRTVRFDCALETNINNSKSEDREDVVVYVVDRNIDEKDYLTLLKRALKLKHQEDVDTILDIGVRQKEKMRTVGFPTHDHPNCLTEMDYEKNELVSQPRGFYGTLSYDGLAPNQYVLTETNWKEGEYRGFSGSPVIALIPLDENIDDVACIPVGIILMASGDIARFVNINVVTNLIAAYLLDQIDKKTIDEIPEIAPGQGAY